MVASHEPAPGGDASAAVAVALAAGLSGMAARLCADHLAGAAALLAEAGVCAAAVIVEINTKAGELSDDRVERVRRYVVRAAGATGGIAED